EAESGHHRGHAGLELAGDGPCCGQNLRGDTRPEDATQDNSGERERRLMECAGQEQAGQSTEQTERAEGHEGAERSGEERAARVARHRHVLRTVARARRWTVASLR